MRIVHIECKPDEYLARTLGVTRRQIVHHDGKSRVFKALAKSSNAVAIVDEDPQPDGPDYPYEEDLVFDMAQAGVARFFDKRRNNIVLVLKVKLEDWLIVACRESKLDMTKPPFSLPDKPNTLHREINYRLPAYEKLLCELLDKKNESLLTLKQWLKE